MARVQVADDVWADFKTASIPAAIAERLGQLVTEDVERYRTRRIRDGHANDQQLIDALNQAQQLHANLTLTIERLERRLHDQPNPPEQLPSTGP